MFENVLKEGSVAGAWLTTMTYYWRVGSGQITPSFVDKTKEIEKKKFYVQ